MFGSAGRTTPTARTEQLASNAELVDNIAQIARRMGREIATPDEARAMLGISKC